MRSMAQKESAHREAVETLEGELAASRASNAALLRENKAAGDDLAAVVGVGRVNVEDSAMKGEPPHLTLCVDATVRLALMHGFVR